MKRILPVIVVFAAFLFGDTTDILILHTNDMRGIFEERPATWMNPDFPPPLGGAASLYTAVQEQREIARDSSYHLLLLDTGSFLGGNIVGEGADPELAVDILNRVGYDVVNIGVHDFLAGSRTFDVIKRKARFRTISANITLENDTLRNPDFVDPYVLLNVGGVKVGIFGLISEYMPLYMPVERIKGFFFLREIPVARRMAKELRDKGAQIVIALTDIGVGHDTLLAEVVPGIDFIIGGFDGRGIREAYEHPVTHTVMVRTYGGVSDLGRLLIHYDREAEVITGYEWSRISLLAEQETPDPLIRDYVEKNIKSFLRRGVDNSGSEN